MCKCPLTEVAPGFLLELGAAAVNVNLVPLQGALAGEFGGTLGALLLVLRGHETAPQVGRHPTLEGEVLLTPVAGVKLGGGGRRGGVSR